MATPVRIIIIDDNADDALFIVYELRRGGFEPAFVRVDTPEALSEALEAGTWDFVISDHSMPLFSAPEALAMVRESEPRLPVIIVSGEIDVDLAVALMRHGARDYVQKNDLARLPLVLEREIREALAEKEHAVLERVLKETRANYQILLENIRDVVFSLDLHGVITYISPVIEELSGFKAEDVIGKYFASYVYAPDLPGLNRSLLDSVHGIESSAEFRVQDKNGRIRYVRTLSRLLNQDGEINGLTGVMVDITEYKEVEQYLKESEERSRLIFDHAPLGLLLLDENLSIQDANATMCEMLAFSRDELTGAMLSELIIDEDMPPVREMFLTASSQESCLAGISLLSKSGQHVYATFCMVKLPENAWLGYINDISEYRMVEENLERSEEEFRKIFNSAPVGIAMVNLNNRFIRVNPAFCDFTGYPESDLLGKTILDVTFPDDRLVVVDDMRAMLEGRLDIAVVEKRYLRQDGSVVWGYGNIRISRDREGRPLYFVGIVLDITATRKAIYALVESEERYRRLNESLERRVKERTAELESFVYSVSHDLRAPLRGIMGFSHILMEDYGEKLDQEGRETIARIIEAGHRMNELMDGLLQLSRVSAMEMDLQPVQLSQLSRNLAQHLQAAEPHRQVEFIIKDEMTILADRRLVQVVLDNVIGNAWKYTSHKKLARIEVGCLNQDGENNFYVRDNGAGFDMQKAGKLFDVFARLHSESEFAGSGVGLAIVRRIIERHGGRIWAEAEVSKGATFYMNWGPQIQN